MDLILGNPFGLLGLLGVPALLVIHLLQLEPRRVVTSTLFLLENRPPESARAARWSRLRSSLPLWLQLLAVLVATWLLVQPRWLREDSVQRVVVVLDSSASMSAFGESLKQGLARKVEEISAGAGHTEWILLDSDRRGGRLHAGSDASALLKAVEAFEPNRPAHDRGPALQAAASLVRSHGTVLFVTDHEVEVPDAVQLLAVGRSTPNVGFTGLRLQDDAGTPRWITTLRNHGSEEVRRHWWIELEGASGPHQALRLAPGESRVLKGHFPEGVNALVLALDGDAFSLDDRLPVVRPRPKGLRVRLHPSVASLGFLPRLLAASEGVERVFDGEEADLVIASHAAEIGRDTSRIRLALGGAGEGRVVAPGFVVAEHASLAESLDWRGLLTGAVPAASFDRARGERAILWRGTDPLVVLAGEPGRRELRVAFDVRLSNADRLPAFVVMWARFIESVRREKAGFEARNLETHARLELPEVAEGLELRMASGGPGAPGRARPLRVPGAPDFFEVVREGEVLLEGASHFADVAEADLSRAASYDDGAAFAQAQAESNSRPDPLRGFWGMLLVGLVIGNGMLVGRAR